MRVLIPFDARNPKTRLSPVLDSDERTAFARVMLEDVLAVLARTAHEPEILSTDRFECEYPVTVDERPLTTAVNAVLDEADLPVAIVMADLALLTGDALEVLFAPTADVVVAPGLGGGTNALVVRHPDFRVDYHGTSYRDHCQHARATGASVASVDSFRLALDVDDPADLVEVLLHGEGAAVEWLRNAGFVVEASEDSPTVVRSRTKR